MLKVLAKIVFFDLEYNPRKIDGYAREYIRPTFNFGKNCPEGQGDRYLVPAMKNFQTQLQERDGQLR